MRNEERRSIAGLVMALLLVASLGACGGAPPVVGAAVWGQAVWGSATWQP